jgi:hypothetical protein
MVSKACPGFTWFPYSGVEMRDVARCVFTVKNSRVQPQPHMELS